MTILKPKALFLVYNKPLRIFVNHLFDGNSPIRIEDLSEEQMTIFNLPLNRSYIVKGGPGTGKTLMAYFRAKRLADNIEVRTWHSWLFEIITNLKLNISDYQYKPYDYIWDRVKSLFEAEIYPHQNYKNTHLFLDEAQDFPKEMADILSKCFENVNIFIDEHQAVERTTKTHEIRQIFDVESNPFPLSKNYRNCPEIYEVARLFFTGDAGLVKEDCHIKSIGLKPKMKSGYSFQDTVDYLTNYTRNQPQKMIGVVVVDPADRSKYFRALSQKVPKVNVQEYKSRNRGDLLTLNDPGIKLFTINTVKGLEFDTVFICDVDHSKYQNISIEADIIKFFNRIYVACSRAKTELYFTCKNDVTKSFIIEKLKSNETLVDFPNDKVIIDENDVPF